MTVLSTVFSSSSSRRLRHLSDEGLL
jgi:hypothetical protein